MSVRRRAIKARMARNAAWEKGRAETTASLNELVERVKADPEKFRAEALASVAALPHRQGAEQK